LAGLWLGLVATAMAAEGVGGGALPYLRAGLSARAMGMGNAHTATVNDATGTYWNPAALTTASGIGLASQLAVLGDGRSWNALSFSHSFATDSLGQCAYGVSWLNFSAGNDIEARTENRPEYDRLFGDTQNAFLLSLATNLGFSLAAGANIKFLTHALDNETAFGQGLDLALWQRLNRFAWGVVVQDLYSTLSWSGRHTDKLPTLTRAGLAWQIVPGTFTLAADGTWEWYHAGEFGYRLGAEYRPLPLLSLRAGADQGRLSAGLGFEFAFGPAVAHLDYAWSAEQLPGAGPLHLVSLNLDFSTLRQPAKPADTAKPDTAKLTVKPSQDNKVTARPADKTTTQKTGGSKAYKAKPPVKKVPQKKKR